MAAATTPTGDTPTLRYARLVAGYDGSDRARDGLALARLMAGVTGAELLVAAVVPREFPYVPGTAGREQAMSRTAAQMLADAAPQSEGVRTQVLGARSAAQGLHELAESEQAGALVVGSSHRGPIGRVRPEDRDQGDPVELGQAVTHHQPRRGLSEAEAAHRLAERAPFKPPSTSRSYASIVAGNVFTVFNAILAVFGALTLAFGDWRDALFLGVLVVNTTIGVTQEARAKRALDRLAALVTPTARVIRAGTERDLEIADVVAGDLVRLQSGDQVVADGHVAQDVGLMLDESILTGESHAVTRTDGEGRPVGLLRGGRHRPV